MSGFQALGRSSSLDRRSAKVESFAIKEETSYFQVAGQALESLKAC
jgi:hypothetical protein